MTSSPPFVDPNTAVLDTDQIMVEAILLAKLIGLFVGLALVPLAVAFTVRGVPGAVFTLVAQFILAVGSGIVLIYAVSRGIQLSSD